jgi:outer membrane protein assembly factor BamD (BamD/ComL family)
MRTPVPISRRCGHGLLLLAIGCTTQPLPPAEAEPRLAAAERHVAASAWDAAQRLLDALAEDRCPKRLRDRRDVAQARVWLGRDEPWEAFRVLEPFADRHPHSELRPEVAALLWEIGSLLAVRGGGFLFFWSDAIGARTVLQHLVTRYPEAPRLADALRVLGDMAFDAGDHVVAQQRFRDLLLQRPDSEWAGYARYRFAMSVAATVEGPDYDLERIRQAVRELQDFLRLRPENPEIARTANEALAKMLAWQAERHLQTAGFYRRIGNEPGALHHLEIAASEAFAGTPAHAEAVAARDELRARAASRGAAAP